MRWLKARWHAGPLSRTNLRCRIDEQGCPGCGGRAFEKRQVIRDHLAQSWGLSRRERDWFDEREGDRCLGCGMNRRVRMLVWSLRRHFPRLEELCVLHVSQVNCLSPLLGSAGTLVETVHQPEMPQGSQLGGLINQDLESLTFADAAFDLVIHSETLEHVFDLTKALAEIHRVLRPGGRQLYTVPVLHHRGSRRRMARAEDGQVLDLLPPSFHGVDREFPVVWELGGDFLQERRSLVRALDYDNFWDNPTIFAVVEQKADSRARAA